MFVTPPIDPIELDALKLLHVSFSPPLLRGLGMAVHFISAAIFARLTAEYSQKIKMVYLIAFFVFLFSPWTSFLATFYPIQNLILLVFLILASSKKLLPIVLILIPTLFFLTKLFGQNYSFLKTLSPSNLAFEINESQRINFLAVERKFILPYPTRIMTYNKPALASNKIINQFVSFFDIEQLIFPDKAYEITKLSGLSPKGNLILFYIWEIPLIIYGLFKLKSKKYLASLFLLGVIPFLFFEKKLLAQTAFLTSIPLMAIEVVGLSSLIKKFDRKFVILIGLVTLIIILNFYKTLFFKPLSYQTPQPYLFREIALWLKTNYDPGKNYTITTRFGATDILTPYYLGQKYPNVIFRSFDLRTDPHQANTVYIGLAGEFVKPGRDLETKDPPGGVEIIARLNGEDEPVFEYGKNIWIGYIK